MKTRTLWLSVLSAVLLILSFPRTNFWFLSWIGLVPLMLALDGKRLKNAFWIGYFCGILFFAGTLYWFVYVTFLGVIALVVYLAVYFALFALGYSLFLKKATVVKLFLLPALWVALEYIRAHLFTGFGWVSLGQSQYKNLALIQIADITGMFGVSFLVVMVNVLIKEAVTLIRNKTRIKFKETLLIPLSIVFCFILITLGYGAWRFKQTYVLPEAKIAIIQANTPQEIKWSPMAWPSIMKEYLTLTRKAAKQNPDLIIWPETSFPGHIWETPEVFEELKSFVAQIKIPLLLGLVTRTGESYFNSAVLISKEGRIIKKHDKLHLVPFGEYIPLRSLFPFLSSIVPIDDFTAGKEYTLFPVFCKRNNPKKEVKNFSVLICFEDTIAELSRAFTNHGANFLVNITNDAWFQDTKAPFVHLQASVFRTIENRRSLVRAANTGVSCFINQYGNVLNQVQGYNKKPTYISGIAVQNIAVNDQTTFYSKYGDVFTYLCFGVILWGIVRKS